MTTDLASFFNSDEFAESVTYAGSAITAIFTPADNLDEDEGGSALAMATLEVKVSDVAAPAYRDAVVVGSATWAVRKILSGDKDVWRLELYRDERPVI